MQASKVTISQETRRKLDNPVLDHKKRRILREQLMKEFIENAGNRKINKQMIVAAAGFDPKTGGSEYTQGLVLIKRLVRKNAIRQVSGNRLGGKWLVLDSNPAVKPTPKQVAAAVVPQPVVELKEFEKLTSVKLVDMAKEFAWKQNSDSLREFIAYVENAIK